MRRRAGTLLHCLECGVESDKLATGWRAYFVEEDDEEEFRVVVFCPPCTERQSGLFRWNDASQHPPGEA
jgi:hypothetical protein